MNTTDITPARTPLRVVVADDNPVVRAGLTALLSGRGDIDVVADAADGRQAYEAAVRTRPDVILLDVRMPGYDGLSALPHLVRLAPVLMMTYSRESEIVREALRLGAGGYLVHGEFTVEQLVAAVRGVREGRPHMTHSASSALLDGVRGGHVQETAEQVSAIAHERRSDERSRVDATYRQVGLVGSRMMGHQSSPDSLQKQASMAHSVGERRNAVPPYAPR